MDWLGGCIYRSTRDLPRHWFLSSTWVRPWRGDAGLCHWVLPQTMLLEALDSPWGPVQADAVLGVEGTGRKTLAE